MVNVLNEKNQKLIKETEEWMKKGHEILNEKYWEYWDKIVPIRLTNLYEGMELGACLDIVGPLNDGCTLDESKDIIVNQGHSGMSWNLVVNMVKVFCDRGEEFATYVDD